MLHNIQKIVYSLAVSVLVICAVTACGQFENNEILNNVASLKYRTIWPANPYQQASQALDTDSAGGMPSNVLTVRIIVTGPDIQPKQADFPASASIGTVDGIPVGNDRTLKIQGLGANDIILFEGIKTNLQLFPRQINDAGEILMLLVSNLKLVNNQTPVANAGREQNVYTGMTVTLDGSASIDVDGDTLVSYAWSFVSIPEGSLAELSSPSAVKPTFVADRSGTYVLQLIVNDGKVNSFAKTVTITSELISYVDPITGMIFEYVPPGTFQMGDTFGDGWAQEQPVHKVTLTKGYWLGRYEVTQKEWMVLESENPSEFKCENHPVVNVRWYDAQHFIALLNTQSGKNYRLPTEAEWEYAARSGGKSEKFAGGNEVDSVAWYNSTDDPEAVTHPVGQKLPNGLGLYDMSGNAYEWVQDWYAPYDAADQIDPTGPLTPLDGDLNYKRVTKGGSWQHLARGVRTTLHVGAEPGLYYAGPVYGFRLLLPVEQGFSMNP